MLTTAKVDEVEVLVVPVEVSELNANVASLPAATAVLSNSLQEVNRYEEERMNSKEETESYEAAAVVLVSKPAAVRD